MLVIMTTVVGYIAKEYHRKQWIILGIISIMLMSYPLFKLLNANSFPIILLVQFIFACGLSCVNGVVTAMAGSLFNDKIRTSGISIGTTLATAIFAGLSPTMCSLLIYK